MLKGQKGMFVRKRGVTNELVIDEEGKEIPTC